VRRLILDAAFILLARGRRQRCARFGEAYVRLKRGRIAEIRCDSITEQVNSTGTNCALIGILFGDYSVRCVAVRKPILPTRNRQPKMTERRLILEIDAGLILAATGI
jgi:hypothetical protein